MSSAPSARAAPKPGLPDSDGKASSTMQPDTWTGSLQTSSEPTLGASISRDPRYHGASSRPGSLTFKFVTVPRKAALFKPQKEHPKTDLLDTTNKRISRQRPGSLPSEEICLLWAKGHTRHKFRALNSHLLRHLENKGRRRKRTGGSQVPSDVSLGCVCASWRILGTGPS